MKNMFAQRVKELRKELNLTQAALGAKFGYGRSTVCDWEIRGKEPSFDVLIELAKIFDVSAGYLLGLED